MHPSTLLGMVGCITHVHTHALPVRGHLSALLATVVVSFTCSHTHVHLYHTPAPAHPLPGALRPERTCMAARPGGGASSGRCLARWGSSALSR